MAGKLSSHNTNSSSDHAASTSMSQLKVVDEAFGPGADLYTTVLGVQPNASSNQIQSAFLQRRHDLLQKLERSDISGKQKQRLEQQVDAVVLAARCLRGGRQRAAYDDIRAERVRQWNHHHNSGEALQSSFSQDELADIPMKKQTKKKKKSSTRSSSSRRSSSRSRSRKKQSQEPSPTSTATLSTSMEDYEDGYDPFEQQQRQDRSSTSHHQQLNATMDTVETGDAIIGGKKNSSFKKQQQRSQSARSSRSSSRHRRRSGVSSPSRVSHDDTDEDSPTRRSSPKRRSHHHSSTAAVSTPTNTRRHHKNKRTPSPPALDQTVDTWDDTLDRTLDTTVNDDGTLATLNDREDQTVLERLQDEIIGALEDTSRSLEQVFNVFTLQEEDITAVTGKIDKAKRQMKRAL